jgi:cytochrome P450
MHEFSPERVRTMRGKTETIAHELIDKCQGRDRIDLVDDFSYPLPVTIICELLGVPREDEPQFQGWATQLATALEPTERTAEENRKKTGSPARSSGRGRTAGFSSQRPIEKGEVAGSENDRGPALGQQAGGARRRGQD